MIETRSSRHGRGGGRLPAAVAGAVLAAALLAGCGGADEEPMGDPPAETAEAGDPAETSESAEDGTVQPTDAASEDADDAGGTDDPDTSDDTDDTDDTEGAGAGQDVNLFEGTWGFGHDTKVLSAEELADLVEEEAEARGPEEMSLDVECEDGVDTGTQDYTARCTAFADEGVEHPWAITVGPADSGLEVEVENAG